MKQSEKILSLGNRAGKRYCKVLRGDPASGEIGASTKRLLQIRFLQEIADNPEIHRCGPAFFDKIVNFRWVEDHWECELQSEVEE